MRLSLVLQTSFALLAAAANHQLPRKIGSYCDAPEVLAIYIA